MASPSLTNQSNLLRTLRPRRCQASASFSSVPVSVSHFSRASTLPRPSALSHISATTRFATPRRPFSSTPSVTFHPSSAKMGNPELVKPITSKAEFDEKILNAKGAVVLDCFATWCGPCKAIAPKVEQFAAAYSDVTFYQIDVDELSDVAAELGVRAMPTFMLFKDGQKVGDVVGANPPALEAQIQSLRA
ncbi:thioredoxin-like protein [Aspergillus spectabilis]